MAANRARFTTYLFKSICFILITVLGLNALPSHIFLWFSLCEKNVPFVQVGIFRVTNTVTNVSVLKTCLIFFLIQPVT